MHCWKCQAKLEDIPPKVPFRAICDHCSSWQHVCVNCKNYKPGLPNNCTVPNTEPVFDRGKNNFCEEFSLLKEAAQQKTDAKDVAQRLFGDNKDGSLDQQPDKDRFDSLFGE